MRFRVITLIVLLLAVSTLAAACGRDDQANGAAPTGETGLGGTIEADGSSTVAPVSRTSASSSSLTPPSDTTRVRGPAAAIGPCR